MICSRQSVAAHKKRNPDKKTNLEAKKRYYQKNREAIIEKQRNYHSEHQAERKQYAYIYHQNNREKKAAYNKEYRQQNHQHVLEYDRRRCRRARILALHSVPYTLEQINARYLEFDGCCAYCKKVCEPSPSMDHFLPISKGGTHTISNILPACLNCNARKHNTDPLVWYKRQEFFSASQWKIIRELGRNPVLVGRLYI